MLIDWFTVIAQIVNFLILLFLLHRFLYQPILKTIDKRQDQMEARWNAADEEKAKAEAAAQEHRQAQRELEERRSQLLHAAKAEADEMRQREFQQAKVELAEKRQQWEEALANEQQSLLADLQAEFGQQVLAIVRRVLRDIANTDLETQTVHAFQQKLQSLDDEQRQEIADALAQQNQPVTVQTSYDLPESSQEDLRQTLRDTHLLNGQAIHFERSPDLLFGIRLQTAAYDLAWSADDYLQDLEKTMRSHPPNPHPPADSSHS
jgi:F-type H+-transporting ATPase subunit b